MFFGAQASLLAFQTSGAFAGENTHHGDSHADAVHAEASSAGMPQLDPEWFASQMFWLAITFVALYVTFGKKILPELSGIIEARRESINDDLNAAHHLKEEAESVHAAYEDALREARNKSTDLFASVADKIQAKTAKKQESFLERSMRDIRNTEKEIAEATTQAMDDMTTIAAEVAAEAAEKIIGISTDVKLAKDVVKNINKKAA